MSPNYFGDSEFRGLICLCLIRIEFFKYSLVNRSNLLHQCIHQFKNVLALRLKDGIMTMFAALILQAR